MKKSFRESLLERAFNLHLNGHSLTEIAGKLNITRTTAFNWSKRHDWKSRKEDIQKKIIEKTGEDYATARSKMLKIYEKSISKIVDHIQADNMGRPSFSDLPKIIREYLTLKKESNPGSEESIDSPKNMNALWLEIEEEQKDEVKLKEKQESEEKSIEEQVENEYAQ